MQAFTDSLRDRYVLERELGRGGAQDESAIPAARGERPAFVKA